MEKEVGRNSKKRINEAIKEFLVWIIGVATLAVMSEQLSEIFFSTWLGSFIEGVTPNILFILFGLSIYWCIQMLRRKHGAWRKSFFILSVVLGTLYFASGVRFVEKYIWLAKGVFGVRYSFIASLLFIGSLLLMATPYTIFLIRRLVNLFKKKANSAALSMEGLFKYDRFDPKNDKPHVGRTQMIEAIVEQVKLLQHSKSSFTIGIEGGWGSGKTTLLEGIKERLRDKTDEYGNHIELVEFSPWAYPDGKNLSVEFLYELKGVLTRYSLKARFVVNAYINALAENTNFIQAIIRLLFPHESLQKVKEKLGRLILLHRVKLVVVIDDLDRLDEEEIAEVFRLLRNTGDLPNMVYLVAYDRLHVESIGANQIVNKTRNEKKRSEEGLAERNKGRFGDGYLDKVINVELDMNMPDQEILWLDIKEEVEGVFSISPLFKSEGPIKEVIAADFFNFAPFENELRTYRKRNQLLNSLKARLHQMEQFKDFKFSSSKNLILLLEVIKLLDFNFYRKIKSGEAFKDKNSLELKSNIMSECKDLFKTVTAFDNDNQGESKVQTRLGRGFIYRIDVTIYFLQDEQVARWIREIRTCGNGNNRFSEFYNRINGNIDNKNNIKEEDKIKEKMKLNNTAFAVVNHIIIKNESSENVQELILDVLQFSFFFDDSSFKSLVWNYVKVNRGYSNLLMHGLHEKRKKYFESNQYDEFFNICYKHLCESEDKATISIYAWLKENQRRQEERLAMLESKGSPESIELAKKVAKHCFDYEREKELKISDVAEVFLKKHPN